MPSKRTPEVESRILSALRAGTPLAVVCREDGMPHPTTWNDWCAADPALKIAHERARDEGFDAIAADSLEIMDAPPERYMTEQGERIDPASVAWAKARAEQRLKLLAKWDPRRYGDKLETTLQGPNGGPIQSQSVVMGVKAEDVPEDVLRWMASNRVENN